MWLEWMRGQGSKGMCMPVLWRLVTPCLTQWFWSHSGRSITLWLVVVCLSKLEHIGTVLQWIIILHWFQCRCFPGVAEAVFAGAVAVMEPEGPMVNMFCNYSMKFSLYLVAMHKRVLFNDRTAQESHESHDWSLWLFVHCSFQRSWTKSVYYILHKHLFAECRIASSCHIEKYNETSPIIR